MFPRFISAIQKPDALFPATAPQNPFIALGDIHGRADLLKTFLEAAPTLPIVCVGDYVDRGDNSADVLRQLMDRPDIICLSGNHEEMMLRFVDAPVQHGTRWLRYSGLQTLASFEIAGISETSSGDALTKARDQLVHAMGASMLTWLRQRPTYWQSGNVAVTHAGADPNLPLADQPTQALHWGHRDFETTQRRDGVWVVHGHTIVDAPYEKNGRIAIDTGAYATGRLTAVLVEDAEVHFETITI